MSNHAALIDAAKAHPFSVREMAYPTPQANEVIIKAGAVAANPVDWKLQAFAFLPLTYPAVFGHDVAGEVVAIGPEVKRLAKGARVLAHGQGLVTGEAKHGTFQEYIAAPETMAAEIPSDMSFEAATVLPLCISTAAGGLFQKTHLALTHPSLSPTSNSKVVLVWGGSSSVGSCAIQLAKAAGYEVVATCSPKNFDYVKSLGAEPFDYSAGAVDSIVSALKGKDVAGVYDAVTEGETTKMCIEILEKTAGHGTVATVMPGTENMSTTAVKVASVMAPAINGNEVGPMIYQDFLPQALAKGVIVPKPDPLIVGRGLEAIQSGVDRCKQGVSAQKVVITMP